MNNLNHQTRLSSGVVKILNLKARHLRLQFMSTPKRRTSAAPMTPRTPGPVEPAEVRVAPVLFVHTLVYTATVEF